MNSNSFSATTLLSREELILAIVDVQTQTPSLLMLATRAGSQGNLAEARRFNHALIQAQAEHLRLALLHNAHYSGPFEIPPIAQPLVNALLTQGDTLDSLGLSEDAEVHRAQAVEIAQVHLPTVGQAEVERARASNFLSQARFNEALVALSTARDLFELAGDTVKMARASVSLAEILQWLGDHERALAELERAHHAIDRKTAQFQPRGAGWANALLSGLQWLQEKTELDTIRLDVDFYRALVNKALGNFTAAEALFHKILPQYRNPLINTAPAIEFQLAAILIEKGEYAQGLAQTARLESLFSRDARLRPKLALLWIKQAEALLALARPAEALHRLDAGLNELAHYPDPDARWKFQWRRGQALSALNHAGAAFTAYDEAIETVNSLRRAPLGYRLDSTYLQDKLPLFDTAIDFAARTGAAEACCRFMEAIKSRTLTATLSIPATQPDENTDELHQRVDALTRELDAIEYMAYQQSEWAEELRQRQDTLQEQRSMLLERIRFADPRWRSLTEPLSFEIQPILSTLVRRNQAALTLYCQPDQLIGVLLKDGECRVATIPLSAETQQILAKYQQNLLRRQSECIPEWFDPSSVWDLEASHLVAPDLLHEAIGAESLVVVPHRSLHLLPWAGLTFEGKRLFEYCPVGILPNLSCLTSLEATSATSPKIALFGAPDYTRSHLLESLKFDQQELDSISDIYYENGMIGDIPTGTDATEVNFWKLARHPEAAGNILHISCHGNFTTGDPLNAGLLFTDARVDAAEIARTPICYDEVILSACSTGYRPTQVRGVELSGDDVLGLPGAFLEAGARSVLVSISLAEDRAASRLLAIYHDARAMGETPLVALQQAQRDMLDSPAFAPWRWIGFTLYGCQ
ncbi:CHAT domain-containing protein [bacterium]|nr:CHAT domain-containing protein [bacterium]